MLTWSCAVAAQVKSGMGLEEGASSVWQRLQQPIACATAFTTLFILCLVPTFDTPEQRNCLALLICVSLLWCTEALPLFVTSMLVPFLAVCLRVMKAPSPEGGSHRLSAHDASEAIFHSMFTQVCLRFSLLTLTLALPSAATPSLLCDWLIRCSHNGHSETTPDGNATSRQGRLCCLRFQLYLRFWFLMIGCLVPTKTGASELASA